MKILMTADAVGGVWTYALQLAYSLRHEANILLATMGTPLSQEQHEEAALLPNVTIAESGYKLEWMEDPWEDVKSAGEWLLDLEETFAPDLVHLNNYCHAALPWRAPTLAVGHSCVLSWYARVRGEAAPPSYDRYRQEVTRGLQAANFVIAPTRAILSDLERYYGPFHHSAVIYNGRDAQTFRPSTKERLVLTVGRLWDEAKNAAALEKIAPHLEWPIYVAGDDRHPDGGLARLHNLHLLGRLSSASLAPWFARAAIYALPARYEPFGLSALEAGLAGCALVLGDIPSLREVWGNAALFVQPGDTDALKAAINTLIADEPYRAQMATRAHRRACEYTPQRMAAGYRAAYERLLSTGDRTSGKHHDSILGAEASISG